MSVWYDAYGKWHEAAARATCSNCTVRFRLRAAGAGEMTMVAVLSRGRRRIWESRPMTIDVIGGANSTNTGAPATPVGGAGAGAPTSPVGGTPTTTATTPITTNVNTAPAAGGAAPPPPAVPNPDLGTELTGSQTLGIGQYITSPDGQYELVMQGDGNLVEYQNGTALWSSQTGGESGATATMQADGNLVLYRSGSAIWNSQTQGFPGAYLSLQNDSNLVLYQDGHPIWDRGSGYLGDELQGWTLGVGAYLLSANRAYELIMQGDGNLVEYQSGTALWSTQTGGDSGATATMQADGNLVLYRNGAAVWNSQTGGHTNADVILQNDSNLVIYQNGTAIWDRSSGLLTGGGSSAGPTAAEQQAVAWAVSRLGSTAFNGLCLTFVYDAYLDGAGINLEGYTSGVTYSSSTYPQDVWGHFTHGTTGTGTPPYGALVFFNSKPGYSIEYSHVMIMGSGGEMISTTDAFNESDVHYETLAQQAASGAYASYVGWWLPDGS